MNHFSADWLSLREPLDAASRSAELSETLAQMLRRDNPHNLAIQVIDLGAGTAANLHYLAPVIGGWQDWLLVERDLLLLDAVNERIVSWARSREACVIERDRETRVYGRGFNCRIRGLSVDLANEIDQIVLPHGGLVSSSAFLDLVSKDWLAKLAERCAEAAAPVCFALTYDGRIECNPADPEDAAVRDLVNTHQQTDKGFGAALGPDAARYVTEVFEVRGYETRRGSSDWRVGRAQQALQRALVDGWFSAACEAAPERAPELQKWRERRCALVDDGKSELMVGHVDIIGWPNGGGDVS